MLSIRRSLFAYRSYGFFTICFKIFLLLMFFACFFITQKAIAATYYVATNGNNNNPGTQSQPWATFAYAMTQISNGDTLIAKAGTYSESISITKSVTVRGTLSNDGSRLSILEPYTTVSGGWTLSDGVYTKNLGYKAWDMAVVIAGVWYKIHRLCQVEDNPTLQRFQDYCPSWLTHLKRSTDVNYKGWLSQSYSLAINFWHGFEALFSSSADGSTYLRFKDGDNVNDYTLYASTAGNATISVAANDVAIKDFEIRAKVYGVYSSGYSTLTVENNRITLGKQKIYINSGIGHIVKDNILTDYLYSDYYVGLYERGGWGADSGDHSYANQVRVHMYHFTKYGVCADSPQNESMGLYANVTSIDVQDNEISYMNQGMETHYTPTFDIFDNYFHHFSSASISGNVGYSAMSNGVIRDNTFNDAQIHFRPQGWHGLSGTNNAYMKIYSNKFWQKTNIGSHIFFFYWGSGSISTVGKAWIYHNSFTGGQNTVQVSPAAGNYSPRGMGGVYLINNILSTKRVYDDQSYGATLGGCWYNWMAGSSKCSHGSNIDNGTALMWDSAAIHDFGLPDNSTARNAGIDISKNFMIGTTTYKSLPGYQPGYYPGSKPNMGAINISSPPPPSSSVPGAPFLNP